MKRIFYRKSDKKQIWYHEVVGGGEFPTTIEEDLKELPNKVISLILDDEGNIIEEVKIGGTPDDFYCEEVEEELETGKR